MVDLAQRHQRDTGDCSIFAAKLKVSTSKKALKYKDLHKNVEQSHTLDFASAIENVDVLGQQLKRG